MDKIRYRYNDIMCELGLEYLTIGTHFSENTDGWGIPEMVKECKYQLSVLYEDGTSFGDMRYDDDPKVRKQWKRFVGRLSRFIKAYEEVR